MTIKSNSEKISVIMPTFNVVNFVERSVESILGQSHSNLSLTILDGGSTDGTLHLLGRYSAPRMFVIDYPLLKNGSISAWVSKARNEGMARANSKWVTCMDADDDCWATRLERQLELLNKYPDLIAIATSACFASSRGNIKLDSYSGRLLQSEHRDPAVWIPQIVSGSVIMRRDLAIGVGGYRPDFPIGEDVDLWYRLAEVGTFGLLDSPLYIYRIHSRSIICKTAIDGSKMERIIHDFSRQRINYGADPLQRGEGMPPLPWKGQLYAYWRVMSSRCLEAEIDGNLYAAIWFALIAFFCRPRKRDARKLLTVVFNVIGSKKNRRTKPAR